MTVVLANSPPDVIAFALEGENDAYDAERLRSTLASLPRATLPLIVDLSRATFIDSSVVAVLLECLQQSRKECRLFAVFLPESSGEYVRRLFELTRLDSLLPVYHEWDTALENARHGQPPGASSPLS